jgi:hypothetical protein
VTAPLDVQNSGHTELRAEIYMGTTNENLDADGAQLINTGLENGNFEDSSAGWFQSALASDVNLQQYNPGSEGAGYAKNGNGFLEMNTSQPEGSVAQDVSVALAPGQSYTFSVWLRATPGESPFSVDVALWALGGTQEQGATGATVGQSWTLVTAPLDVQNSGHTELRAEIYMGTTNENLDADGATLAIGGAQAVSPPDAPTAASAIAGQGMADVSWSAPVADGGSPISSYRVTATDTTTTTRGGQSVSGSTSPLTVTGLAPGDSYAFTVTATNAAGTSPASAPSNTVTIPKAPTATTLTVSRRAIAYGNEQTEHLAVTVLSQYSGSMPTGTVTVKESTTTLCVIKLSAAKGSCALSAKKLSAGTYRLVATYSGSTDFNGSTSVKETLTVAKATSKTALKLSNARVTYGDEQVLKLSVTVSPEFAGSTPARTVTIKESTTTLCVIKLSGAKGSCTLSAKKLPVGTFRQGDPHGHQIECGLVKTAARARCARAIRVQMGSAHDEPSLHWSAQISSGLTRRRWAQQGTMLPKFLRRRRRCGHSQASD